MKNIAHIPFQEIDSIPKLIKDFLDNKIGEFSEQKLSIDNIAKQIEKKSISFTSAQREVLYEVLASQHSGTQLSASQKENLNLLKESNTYTVTTGHQLNLFTGPLYFIYKILQTIKTAKFLKENFPERNFVPIFWMASEDHDFLEINHFKTPEHYFEFNAESGGAVGDIIVQDAHFIARFEEEFKDYTYGTELVYMMKEAYQKGNSLAEATRTLANRLFEDYGLLLLDGNSADLKRQMIPIFKQELFESKVEESTARMVEFLSNNYQKVQVNPREINLFYLSSTRNRIEREGERFKVVDTDLHFTKSELLVELEGNPERFSPNALLRPVYQEVVLPNLAYIGGNAEIMYWMELKDYFNDINLPFPILIPRNSLLFLRPKTFMKMEKLGFEINDFFGNFASKVNGKLLDKSQLSGLLDAKKTELQNMFSQIKEKAVLTDVTFQNLVQAEEVRQMKSFSRMEKRLLRAERIKQREALSRIEELFLEIHPGKNWQERVFNFSWLYMDYGSDWLQNCYNSIDVQNSGINIVEI